MLYSEPEPKIRKYKIVKIHEIQFFDSFCEIFFKLKFSKFVIDIRTLERFGKVEKIKEDSVDLIPSPSLQIIGKKAYLR